MSDWRFFVNVIFTLSTFYYLGWWLEHEEDLGYGPAHAHAGASYYHIFAIPYGWIWATTTLCAYKAHTQETEFSATLLTAS